MNSKKTRGSSIQQTDKQKVQVLPKRQGSKVDNPKLHKNSKVVSIKESESNQGTVQCNQSTHEKDQDDSQFKSFQNGKNQLDFQGSRKSSEGITPNKEFKLKSRPFGGTERLNSNRQQHVQQKQGSKRVLITKGSFNRKNVESKTHRNRSKATQDFGQYFQAPIEDEDENIKDQVRAGGDISRDMDRGASKGSSKIEAWKNNEQVQTQFLNSPSKQSQQQMTTLQKVQNEVIQNSPAPKIQVKQASSLIVQKPRYFNENIENKNTTLSPTSDLSNSKEFHIKTLPTVNSKHNSNESISQRRQNGKQGQTKSNLRFQVGKESSKNDLDSVMDQSRYKNYTTLKPEHQKSAQLKFVPRETGNSNNSTNFGVKTCNETQNNFLNTASAEFTSFSTNLKYKIETPEKSPVLPRVLASPSPDQSPNPTNHKNKKRLISQSMNQTLIANKTISIFIRDASQLNQKPNFQNQLIDIASDTQSSFRDNHQKNSPASKKHQVKKPMKVSLDFDEVKGGDKRMTLPQMIKPQPKTTKEKDLKYVNKSYDYKLPSTFKFVSDENQTDIDQVRDKLRMNYIDHKNFDPIIGSKEGQRYYAKVYQPNHDYLVSPKKGDANYKNRILNIRESDDIENPYEIDPMRDPAVAASRYVDSDGVKHIDMSLLKQKGNNRKKQDQELTRQEEEDQERDLLNFIFKYENFVKETAMIERVVRSTTSQDDNFQLFAPKTEEQKELEMVQESLQTKNLCKQFTNQLKQIESGEMQINLNESAQIERSIHQFNLLQKFKPLNYEGTLQDMINEINHKFDSGWEIDYKLVKKNLAESYQTLLESRNRKNKATAYKAGEILPTMQTKKVEETQEDKILRQLGGDQLASMDTEQLALYGVNNMMSLIELQSLQDKVNDKLRQVEINHKLSLISQEQDIGKLSKKEQFKLRMAEQAARQKKGLTFKQIFEQEKIAEYNRRQKMFNQMRVVNRSTQQSNNSLKSRPRDRFSSVNLQSIISRISQQTLDFKSTNEKIETVKKEKKDITEAQMLQQRQEILNTRTKILARESSRLVQSGLEESPRYDSNLQKYVSVKNVTENVSPVTHLTPASPTRNFAEQYSDKYQIPQNIIMEDDEVLINEDTEQASPDPIPLATDPSIESNQDLVNLILDREHSHISQMTNLLGRNQQSHRGLTNNNSTDLQKSKNEDIQLNTGEIVITDTKANRLRNNAIFMRELQVADILYFLRLGISKKDKKAKQNQMIEENDVNTQLTQISARENLLKNSLSFDYHHNMNKGQSVRVKNESEQAQHMKKAKAIQNIQEIQNQIDLSDGRKPDETALKLKRGAWSIEQKKKQEKNQDFQDFLSPKLKMISDQRQEGHLKVHKIQLDKEEDLLKKQFGNIGQNNIITEVRQAVRGRQNTLQSSLDITSLQKSSVQKSSVKQVKMETNYDDLEFLSEVDQEESFTFESDLGSSKKESKKVSVKLDNNKLDFGITTPSEWKQQDKQEKQEQPNTLKKADNKLHIEIPQLSVIFKNKDGDSTVKSQPHKRGSTIKMRDFKKHLLNKKPVVPDPIIQGNNMRNVLHDQNVVLKPEKLGHIKFKMKQVHSKLDLGLPQVTVELSEQQREERQEQIKRSQDTRQKATDIMRSVETQFQRNQLRKNSLKDKKMNRKRANCKKKDLEMISGIDSFQFQNQKLEEISDLLTLDEIKESLPQIKDIIKQNRERDQFDHTNFLSVDVAQKFKQDNYDNSEKLNFIGKGSKVWQPNKLRLNVKVFGNQIERSDEYKL